MTGGTYNGDPGEDVAGDAGTKRKSEESQQQPRAKRNRYISIACNECKRRKIKCNGQTPCQRCGNLNLECQYTPNCCNNFKESEEFKQMNAHIAALQDQVNTLFANLSNLRNHIDATTVGAQASPFPSDAYSVSLSQHSGSTPTAPVSRLKTGPKPPRFNGPTSSAFNIGVAKSSLQTMGITGPEDVLDDTVTAQITPATSPPPAYAISKKATMHKDKDPLYALNRDEATRLCRLWEDEMGIMYPVVDMEKLIRHTNLLYTFVEAATRTGIVRTDLHGPDGIYDEQTLLLKVILSIALLLEGHGQSELGKRMFESIHEFVEAVMQAPADTKSIRMLSLAAMYHFHQDDEGLAWRIAGLAARQCMELGLHRRETYQAMFPDEDSRVSAVKLFWSIYVLDRRWSFGTGMPFALQDTDIDPQLPKPDESTPYLGAMIAYSIIGSKVWKSVANANAASNVINKEDIGYLDYQVIQWHRSIPDQLKYTHPETGQEGQPANRMIQRLRIVLYLRANQMRILIYRPVLHTATSIMNNMNCAQVVVDVAKDTIRVLTHTNQTTDLYRTQQMLYNYFLISALAVLFLAVSHAPAQFSTHCRDEFYMALDLVRGLSAESYIAKRLWRTIRALKEVAPKLGLNLHHSTESADDAHSTAAMAMAGLAGHNIDEMSAAYQNGNGRSLGTSPNGMANDLTHLFEAAGAFHHSLPQNGFAGTPDGMHGGQGDTPLPSVFGNEDELSKILRDLF